MEPWRGWGDPLACASEVLRKLQCGDISPQLGREWKHWGLVGLAGGVVHAALGEQSPWWEPVLPVPLSGISGSLLFWLLLGGWRFLALYGVEMLSCGWVSGA